MCVVFIAHGSSGSFSLLVISDARDSLAFIFVFDPSNVLEASDVILDPELCVQSAEEALMSAQLLYWLEVSERFLHAWSRFEAL